MSKRKPVHRRIREHPSYWLFVAVLIGLLFGTYVFQFFSGLYPLNPVFGLPVHADPTIITGLGLLSISDVSARISQPPIIIVPKNTFPLNVTYNVFTNGNRTAYAWWYQWPNSTAHIANIWEPVIPVYDITNPLAPSLVAIIIRFHFIPRPVYGGWTLNGTRPFISFSSTFFVPTVATGPISQFLRPVNATTIFTYPYRFDPNSPPATGPNAYQASAGPFDPWALLGGPQTLQNGLVFGSLAFLGTSLLLNFIFNLTVASEARRNRLRMRQELLPFLVED